MHFKVEDFDIADPLCDGEIIHVEIEIPPGGDRFCMGWGYSENAFFNHSASILRNHLSDGQIGDLEIDILLKRRALHIRLRIGETIATESQMRTCRGGCSDPPRKIYGVGGRLGCVFN